VSFNLNTDTNVISELSITRDSEIVNEVTIYTFFFKTVNPFDKVRIQLPLNS